MSEIIAVTGSITSAARLQKELERDGCINSRVVHTPSVFNKGGCSYSVKLPYNCLESLFKVMKHRRIKVKKVYEEKISGGETVYNDLS